jgi:hypothetical protein
MSDFFFIKLSPTVAAMRSAGLRGYVYFNHDEPCLRELNLKSSAMRNLYFRFKYRTNCDCLILQLAISSLHFLLCRITNSALYRAAIQLPLSLCYIQPSGGFPPKLPPGSAAQIHNFLSGGHQDQA